MFSWFGDPRELEDVIDYNDDPQGAQNAENQVQEDQQSQAERLQAQQQQGFLPAAPALDARTSAFAPSSDLQTGAAGQASGQASDQAASGARRSGDQLPIDRETAEERAERLAAEPRERVDQQLLRDSTIETIADAALFCQQLITKQLERAADQQPEMNAPIYGDAEARRAVRTLLPDSVIRTLFLNVTLNYKNWPRIRPLFGSPPFNFLRPEDAGRVRATGISAGRVNMTYDDDNTIAAYTQFGSGHLIDSFAREYRVVPQEEPKMSDPLPHDLERTADKDYLFMHVRASVLANSNLLPFDSTSVQETFWCQQVPRRRREDKMQRLKDSKLRATVVFPAVGETLAVTYSSGLRRVWGEKAEITRTVRCRVTRMIPRSSQSSTAAVVALRV